MKKYIGIFIALMMLCLTPLSVGAEEPLVNINVVNGNVRDILTSLADIGQVNLVADDSVNGKITVQITDTPFSSALDIVTKIKGLTYQRVGNVLIVGSNDKMSNNFGSVNVFRLKYARAQEVAETISIVLKDGKAGSTVNRLDINTVDTDKKTLSQPVSVRLRIDDATNSIIFYGSPSETEQIQKILDEIDIPYQQVSLEAKVISLNKSASKDLGITWSWSTTPQMPEYTTTTEDVKRPMVNADGSITTQTYSRDKVTIDRSKTNAFTGVGGVIRFGSLDGHPYEFYYQAKINAQISKGNANILARPQVTTLNGKEAVINIGEQVPIRTTSVTNSTSTESITYRDAGIILKYTPRINPDGLITALVHTEVSEPSYNSAAGAYTFTNRSADTQVRLKDGETMVIGGLINSKETHNFSKVPILGDLPLLSALFKSTSTSKDETEIVIFLTAKIVK